MYSGLAFIRLLQLSFGSCRLRGLFSTQPFTSDESSLAGFLQFISISPNECPLLIESTSSAAFGMGVPSSSLSHFKEFNVLALSHHMFSP